MKKSHRVMSFFTKNFYPNGILVEFPLFLTLQHTGNKPERSNKSLQNLSDKNKRIIVVLI